MNILVTGGKGAVGAPLVARLVRSGQRVTVLDRSAAAVPAGAHGAAGAEYIQCDVNDYAALLPHFTGIEAVIHLAAIPNPGGAAAEEIFRINCSGTFNVYTAAAAAGIQRVVTASSINHLGYYYGVRDFPLRYFPIDEEHPNFTTDAYSFSKQVTEQIADYFWRRDGISSVCLRLPGVYPNLPDVPHHVRQWIERARQSLRAFMELPEAERQAQLAQLLEHSKELRTRRIMEIPWDRWQEIGYNPFDPQNGLLSSRANFWASINAEDSAQAFEKAALAPLEGSHALFVNDDHNNTGLPSEELLHAFFPDVTRRTRPLVGSESLVSIEKARALIGFEPEYSFSRLG